MASKLTSKQQFFVREYLIDLNATQAAIRAGYSAKTARAIGERLLKKPQVAAAIKTAMDQRSRRTDITANRVILELVRVAFLDIGEALNLDGTLKPLDQMDEDTRRCIAGLEIADIR